MWTDYHFGVGSGPLAMGAGAKVPHRVSPTPSTSSSRTTSIPAVGFARRKNFDFEGGDPTPKGGHLPPKLDITYPHSIPVILPSTIPIRQMVSPQRATSSGQMDRRTAWTQKFDNFRPSPLISRLISNKLTSERHPLGMSPTQPYSTHVPKMQALGCSFWKPSRQIS